MNSEIFDIQQKRRLLDRLALILNFEIATGFGYLFYFLYEILIMVFAIAALLLTPFMLFVLFKIKKFGWIVFFFLITGIPLVLSFIVSQVLWWPQVFLYSSILGFYFYCFLLRVVVNDDLKNIVAKENLYYQKDEMKKERQLLKDQYGK